MTDDNRGEARDMDIQMDIQRSQALTDGVFAIVMTLLVLKFGLPTLPESADSAGFFYGLLELVPQFAVYVITFLVLGKIWLVHHVQYDVLRGKSHTMQWINIVFLMFVALIPFSTALMGEHLNQPLAVTVYGVNLMLIGLTMLAFSRYAVGQDLVRSDADRGLIHVSDRWIIGAIILLIVGILLAFLNPVLGIVVYGVIPLWAILPTASNV